MHNKNDIIKAINKELEKRNSIARVKESDGPYDIRLIVKEDNYIDSKNLKIQINHELDKFLHEFLKYKFGITTIEYDGYRLTFILVKDNAPIE